MKKLIAIGIIAIAVLTTYFVELGVAKKYEFELVSSTSDIIVADGYSSMRVTVRLLKDNKPVEGHTVNIVCSNGTLPAYRMVTDHDGLFTFRYYAYLYLDDRLTPLTDVVFSFEDESNSTIFMVSAKGNVVFKAEKPEEEIVWEDWQDIEIDGETI